MVRTSIYDRISEKRLALEAQERLEAELADNAPAIVIEPEPTPVLQLQPARNELTIAGLDLVLPQSCSFRNIDITLDKEGNAVTVSVKRRPAPDGLTLQRAVDLYVENLRKLHSDITIVRQSDCVLAGSAANALDYIYTAGQATRHGRAVSSIIDPVSGGERQWLNISTMIDPNKAALGDWLIDFDAMLETIAAR